MVEEDTSMVESKYAYVEEIGAMHGGMDVEALVELFSIHRIHRRIMTRMDKYFSSWGLNSTGFWLLFHVISSRDRPLSPAELAEECGLARPSMTSALDVLQRRGYVKRQADLQDRRMIRIHMTPTGERFMNEVFPEICQGILRIAFHLKEAERKSLMRLFRKVEQGVGVLIQETE